MQPTRMLTWFEEVWHKRTANAIDRLLHPSAEIHGLDTEQGKKGQEGFKPFYENFCKNFPKINVDVTPIFVNDEFEAVHCDVTGEDASGKNVHFKGICIGRFKNGQLIEGWNGFDFITMHKQLGFSLVKQEEPQIA